VRIQRGGRHAHHQTDQGWQDAADTILALAAGMLSEEAFRGWVADHCYDIGDPDS